jgi:hypothetical protein
MFRTALRLIAAGEASRRLGDINRIWYEPFWPLRPGR